MITLASMIQCRALLFDCRQSELTSFPTSYGTVHAYQIMTRQGHGHIVNISSLGGLVSQPGNTACCTSKHGIVGLSLSQRCEGADLGVKVSAVCPGDMKTKIYDNMVVVNMPPREQGAALSRRTHYLMPQMSAQDAARAVLRGVARNQALILFPTAVQLIWRLYRLFPSAFYRISIHRMRLFRSIRTVPGTRSTTHSGLSIARQDPRSSIRLALQKPSSSSIAGSTDSR
jgi:short-subunit dehydrogenase